MRTSTKLQFAVFGKPEFAKQLANKLEKIGPTYLFDPEKAVLPVLVHPTHFFYFLRATHWQDDIHSFEENLNFLPERNLRIIILGINLAYHQKIQLENRLKENQVSALKFCLTPIVGGSNDHALSEIVDQGLSSFEELKWLTLGVPENQISEIKFEPEKIVAEAVAVRSPKRQKNLWKILILLLAFLIVFILTLGASVVVPFYLGVSKLEEVRNTISLDNDTSTLPKIMSARDNFDFGQKNLSLLSSAFVIFGQKNALIQIDNMFSLSKVACDTGSDLVKILPVVRKVAMGIMDDSSPVYSSSVILNLKPDIDRLSQNLALAQIKLDTLSPYWQQTLMVGKYRFFQKSLSDSRVLISGLDSILSSYNSIFGVGSKKSYLIVLQNPAELRPTGGFIGSFAIVNFDQGKLIGLKLHDIYSADGQLRGHITPPDEIFHYLGQPNWYMRDSNWAADFPLTAKRLEWFLEKEIGERVDGVVGVDIHAIEKILKATGPIAIPEFNDMVNTANLFEKAEFRSEINFFPGSTQKKDFLNAVLEHLGEKFSSGKLDAPGNLIPAITSSLNEKNILFYANDSKVQSALEQNNWAGKIYPDNCDQIICLAAIDANLGANKSNYYLQRAFNLNFVLGQTGEIDGTLLINYTNNSPSNTWPGGDYKNYLRVYLPLNTVVSDFNVGDDRKPFVSPNLNEAVLTSIPNNQFLLKTDSESGYSIFGALVLVPVGKDKTVSIKFKLPTKLNFVNEKTDIKLNFIKQPGTNSDRLSFVLEYPAFLTPIKTIGTSALDPTLVFSQKFVYNTYLDANKDIQVNLARNQK